MKKPRQAKKREITFSKEEYEAMQRRAEGIALIMDQRCVCYAAAAQLYDKHESSRHV